VLPVIEEPGSPVRRTGHRVAVYLGLATVTLLNLISYAPVQPNAHEKAWGDAAEYYAMSVQTGAQVDNPFALRMLSPWLVHTVNRFTGVSLDSVWLAFTFALVLAAAIVFFEFLWTRLDLRLYTSALAATALACTFWYAPYAFSNPYLVDPLNNLLYLVALWLLFDRRLIWFALVIVVGTINKETTLLLAPLYPLAAWTRSRSLRDKQVVGGLVAVVVAAGLYFAFRLWAQALIGGDYGFGAGQANSGLLSNIRFALSSNKGVDQAALYSTFGFFWLIFAYGLYLEYRRSGTRSLLLVSSVWLGLCCLAGRMVATDTQRVFVMLAPLVIGLVAVVLDRHRGDARRIWVGVVFFLYFAVNYKLASSSTIFLVGLAGLLVFVLLEVPPFWPKPPAKRDPVADDGPPTEEFLPHRGSLDRD